MIELFDFFLRPSYHVFDKAPIFAVNPYCTTNKIAVELGIAYSTAQRGIQKLEAAGIIKKTNDNKQDKVNSVKGSSTHMTHWNKYMGHVCT